MSVFHCPLCPLIFGYRAQVEQHLRNEHRSRAEKEALLASGLAGATRELTWDRLRDLQVSRAGTAVTILIGTTPAPSMTSLDVARLRRLAHQARHRLAAEPGCVPGAIESRLARAVAIGEGAATQKGLAVLVNAHQLAIFHLPFEPADRVVIDPTFATRDLEITLRCYPRYRLVVLGNHPRIFEGRGVHLAEMESRDSTNRPQARPLSPPAGPWGGKRSARPERWSIGRARRHAGVHLADEIITARVRDGGELPLLVAGDGRWRAQFRHQSQHANTVAGEISGIRSRDRASRLAELAQPHLAARLKNEQAAAVTELERADCHAAVAWGLKAAWAAVHEGAADVLWIEGGYARPGRVSGDPQTMAVTSDPDQPGVNNDLVDDLIQIAHARGIAVHLLSQGTIDRPEPIAARLRPATVTNQSALKEAV